MQAPPARPTVGANSAVAERPLAPAATRWALGWGRRRALVAAVAAALVLGGGAVALVALAAGEETAATRATPATTTALVARRDLVQRETVVGTLGFADPRNSVATTAGTITWLSEAGALIAPGRVLYRLDGRPVFLLDGAEPASRSFAPGMEPGRDVLQLKRALRQLGYDPARQMVLDQRFDFAARAIVERWQRAVGLEPTGTIPLGQVVFQPGSRRVGELQVSVGQPVTEGELLFATSSAERLVTGTIDASLQSALRVGDPVSVDLLNGTVARGTITAVDDVATAAEEAEGEQQGGGAEASSTVGFRVRLNNPRVAGKLAQAPVTIDVARERANDVLSVPVTALLALDGGGYGVQVMKNGVPTLVAVRPGFYSDDGYVEIEPGAVEAGARVVVPR
jgi:peptidoglycan hydrolase-like protein with peptidoglycan-binding domain